MDISEIKNRIHILLDQAHPEEKAIDDDTDLFSDKTHIEPRELLFVFMELKKSFPIDYNVIIERIDTYTVNQIAHAIYSQM